MDVLTPEQRSRNMAAVRSRGNKSTEGAILQLFREYKITGWRRHYKKIKGAPDFVFLGQKTAVFIDGCFWHKCPRCFIAPATRREFWQKKINSNVLRDINIAAQLKKAGWEVLRIWEHQIKNDPKKVIKKIQQVLGL